MRQRKCCIGWSRKVADTRAGLVALVGEPNAGKSTLMNRIIGSKVSIVTHKAQTTRSRIRGITVRDQTQIVFVDTPGLFEARNRLDRAMVAAAWKSLSEADIVLLLAPAHRGVTDAAETILERLGSEPGRRRLTALAINKIDLVRPRQLLELASAFAGAFEFDRVFMISATNGSGVDDVADWLADSLPEGPFPYPEDQIADAPLQAIAAEITREKLMLRMHQEIPYKVAVETECWTPRRDGTVSIEQTVYAASKSHKKMIIGPGGSVIRQIGADARRDIQQLLGCGAHLFLRVKLRPKWAEDAMRYERIGLSFSDAAKESKGWRG